MSSELETASAPDSPNFAPRLYSIAILVGAIVIIGMWLVGRFADLDRARDLQSWQEKLNLIAESRVSDINQWVSGNFKELRTLADNPSLQLYMTELQMIKPADEKDPAAKSAPSTTEPAQKAYLRNVLLFTAQRAGFSPPSTATAIPANVVSAAKSGLAIIDAKNETVVSTVMQPSTQEAMLEHIGQAKPAEEGLIDIRKDKEGAPYIGFIVPVFSIQGDHDAASQIGRIIGLKTVDNTLFDLLKHPGVTEKTLEAILVRPNGTDIEYISPLQDGTSMLSKHMSFSNSTLAEAKLIQSTGNFIAGMKDYSNREVLATSRPITGTPWTLILKIDRHEALAKSEQRRTSMVVFCFLIIAVIALIVIAIWRYAHSKRSMMMSTYFRRLAARAVAQERLLRLVADNQVEPIYIVDNAQIVRFANQKLADNAHMSVDSIPGKTLSDVRGAGTARPIAEQCDKALKAGYTGHEVLRMQENGEEKIIRNAYVPLDHIPIVTLPEPTPGVLVVEQDISEIVHEREQRLATQRQLIEMLVKLVDKRDPFAANHSHLVSKIAHEVGADMELDTRTVETARIAGNLMNIGKIVVPTELLTKTERLTADEKRTIHDSMNAATELLKDIDFEGPVAETLRQWQEKWDGTGPLGLKGEAILISARIIAVVNAFVGMISPRSWRTAMAIEAANKILLDQSDTDFDRKVVIALINYVENHNGRAWLQKVLEEQKVA